MSPTVIDGSDGLRVAVGTHLGHSDWITITQERIDTYAEATGDHQWIHVDPERAAAESPYGGTIAHGYLTLALTNLFLPQIVEVRGFSMGVNYGVNKVRFPAAVPVGARVRGGAELTDVSDVANGVQTTMVVTVEVDGSDRPGCVAEAVSRWIH